LEDATLMNKDEGFPHSPTKTHWFFFAIYLALLGSFCGLEVDTFVQDLPFFQVSTFLLLANVFFVLLVPPLSYALFASMRSFWRHRAARSAVLILNAIYIHMALFLAIYKSDRKLDFDFNFLWFNTGDALPVLWKIYAPWLFVVFFSIVAFVFLQKPAFSPVMALMAKSRRKAGIVLAALFLTSVFCQVLTIHSVRGSAAGFVYANFLSDRRVRSDYHAMYRAHIDQLRSESPRAYSKGHPSILGDMVFFVKQESLNGLLLKPRITPQLLRASHDGILFSDFYGNSIQSIRGYECILCGVPPNLTGALVDEYTPEELKGLSCLPRVFKSFGYHPLYFFAGSRNARIMQFAESIGFEKVLADDIMQPQDIKFDWGYREDIFYARVFEYLRRYHATDKVFVFIDTGATNHTPFKVLDPELVGKVPFTNPKAFEEHLSNTTFVQDHYFGHLYDLFRKHYGSRGSMMVASDHSWPIPIHKNNIYNERGAYEENFRIPMVFIPPSSQRNLFSIDTVVTRRFSQMDIFPTILNLTGLDQRHLLGESFTPWLLVSQESERAEPRRTKISVQPYGGGYISAVLYPEKYIFDVLGRNYTVYDLEKDPGEKSPSVHPGGEHSSLIREFFHPELLTMAKSKLRGRTEATN
jgi:arylsulfatase A-like enzyme